MHVGFNLRQLVETVQLLQDCKWTSTIAEQQQSSVVALTRAQPEYHEVTLVARAQVLATTALLPKADEGCCATRPLYADDQGNRAGARWSSAQDGRERARVREKEANRMAVCRKNISDALDEVQHETLGLRKRIAGALLIEERQ